MHKKLPRFLETTIEYAFYLFVFLLPWQTKLIIRPAETNFSEISIYASHLLLLVILIAFFAWQLRRKEDSEAISPLWLSLAALELAVLISFFFASDQFLAFYHYVLLLMGIGLFYMLRAGTLSYSYEDSRFSVNKVITSFLASVLLQASLGIYQFLMQFSPANKSLGLAAHQADILGTSVIETESGRWLRAYGGLDHPNILAGVLAVALIITAYLLAERKMIRSKTEAASSLLLFIFYFIALTALFFTFSRAGWLAYISGLGVLLALLIYNRDRWMLGRYLALLFFSAVMIFIVAFPYRDLAFARTTGAWQGEGRLEQKSLQERSSYIDQAGSLIKECWIFGAGAGNYIQALEDRAPEEQAAWSYQPVHNSFLLLFAQSGILSLISFLAFLYFLIKKDRRAVYGGAVLAALIVLMIFDHWLISLPFGVIFLFFVLGLL